MRRTGSLLLMSLMAAAQGCVVDDLIFTQALDEEHAIPPEPNPTVLRGAVDPDRGGELGFWSAGGSRVTPLQAQVDEDGLYEARFSGTDSFSVLRVSSVKGASVTFGLVPELPRAASVYSPPVLIDLADEVPAMARLSDETTTMTLVVEAKAKQTGGLQSLEPAALAESLEALNDDLFDEGPLLSLRQMVTRLQEAALAAPADSPPVFLLPETTGAPSPLNPAFLQGVSVDYDNDGGRDRDSAAFDALLQEATAQLDFDSCLDEERVRLVFQLDFNANALDLNCEVIDRDKWLVSDPGDGAFFTGAVHVDQANCADAPSDPDCLTEEQIAATSKILGDFKPNLVPMLDDGTGGDAVAGDNVWTVVFTVPRGVRIGYKYTYGKGGEIWTGTEEWPGNSRIIQAEDTDGDNVVVRRDYFGDESSNKDKQNSLSPARGGRGTISFDTDANRDGLLEARENQIDTDGDCVPDAKPSPGAVAPVFCDEP